MKKLLLIFLTIFCLFGCGPGLYEYHSAKTPKAIVNPEQIPIWIDMSFNQADREAIIKATNEWNFVLNGQAKFTFQGYFQGDKEGLMIFKDTLKTGLGVVITSNDSDELGDDGEAEGILAFVAGAGAHHMVVIHDHIGNRDLKDIVLHEYGHLLGADHVNTTSLMYPANDSKQSPCVDKITALQVANYLDLDVETLHYCRTPQIP